MSYKVKTLFVSDIHLGIKHSKAYEFHKMLKNIEFENLYLIGDVIDGWELKKSWYWPQEHNNVIQKLMKLSKKGKTVIFLPGNHDEFAKQFDGTNFGDIRIMNKCFYTTQKGYTYVLTHGDIFDPVFISSWIYHIGSGAYNILLSLNSIVNKIRRKFGISYWSLSAYAKSKTKLALSYIKDFETSCLGYAEHNNCDGIICGHIHEPKDYTLNGYRYINTGDWVETCSFAVEHYNGSIELLYYTDMFNNS